MLQRLELDRDELAVALRHGVEREVGKDEAQLVDIQAIATPTNELPHLRLPSSQDSASWAFVMDASSSISLPGNPSPADSRPPAVGRPAGRRAAVPRQSSRYGTRKTFITSSPR